MNLNYDTTTDALKELVAIADQKLFAHNIAVDFDGEVIIDPELHYPTVDIKRYKFCTQIKNESLRNAKKLEALQAALMSTFKTRYTIGDSDIRIAA
jgi:hypothetical protein